MRAIAKGPEPASLAEHRAVPGADFDGYRDKETLRGCLVREQRGLCCYCLSRIHTDRDAMKIEHWHSRGQYPMEQLNYTNLLAACKGNEGKPRRDQHCDTHKGDRELSRNPANPLHRIEESLRFRGDGHLFSDDPAFEADLNEVLNLNQPFLVNNRKAVLDAFLQSLPSYGLLRHATLNRWLLEWNGESSPGELRPFCQVVVYWIRKRMARQ